MRTADFRYDLPEELIAQFPAAERTGSRLLVLGADGAVSDSVFARFGDCLRPGDLLVFNDTRVMPARLHGHKDTGGKVEVLVERLVDERRALCHVRASKPPRPGSQVHIGEHRLRVLGRQGELFELESPGISLEALMGEHGHMPLPPYIQRDDADFDEERYQTIYARRAGAVAAPTAGLHFDQAMLAGLRTMGVETAQVTLHVGAGTFQPVRVDDIARHEMHSEWLQVDQAVVDAVARTRERGGRVVAVGTTSVRSLESAAAGGDLVAFTGDTRLFITPGYKFRVVDALLTNFHLPESTLLMLVAAFAGYEPVMAAYRHAVKSGYRFFSYGDAMFLEKA